MNTHIRMTIRKDLPHIVRIEKENFGDLAWSEEDFLREARQRNIVPMTMEIGEKIVGFALYELHKHKLHVLHMGIDKAFHRKGLGTRLLQHLKDKLNPARRIAITLAVRESNLFAQLFLKKNLFKAFKVLDGFYLDTGEAAYLFKYEIAAEPQVLAETHDTAAQD